MAKGLYGRLLVIGNEADEKAMKYSADKETEPYVKYRFEDRAQLRANQIRLIQSVLDNPTLGLPSRQEESFRELLSETKDMDDNEFYERITEGLKVDDETGDAYSTQNPDAKYKWQKCYDERLKKTGEESQFSDPFVLTDGTKAYAAKKGDIDWTKCHMYNTGIYRAAWEVCVEGRSPENDTEEIIMKNMSGKLDYFRNFADADEYVRHSCCFWTNGIITEDGEYHDIRTDKCSDKKWVSSFYERFIKPLSDDTEITLYEIRSLEN